MNARETRLPRPFAAMVIASLVGVGGSGRAEYGDVVLNRLTERAGVRAVIFPHWFHRIRFRCKVCHAELGFEMRAGANEIDMDAIARGEFCGACHDGDTAWAAENCALCHSGLEGLTAGVRGGHETGGPGRW